MNPNEKGVIFESESSIAPVIIRPSKPTSGMARMVMRITGGLASNETQANYVLIGFVLVAIIFSYLFTFNPARKIPEATQYRDKISQEVRAKLPPGVWETIPAKFR